MRTVMDDEILGRLVAYEKHVKQCFARAASRRWRTMNTRAIQEYEQLKELKNYISALVDLAFDRYGIENGLTRAASNKPDMALNNGLESLVEQLHWPSPEHYFPSPKRQFALVS